MHLRYCSIYSDLLFDMIMSEHVKQILIQIMSSHNSMQYRIMIVFIWLFCAIGRGKSLNNSQTPIFWEPLEPLLFNEDVILKCYIKDCCPDDTQWTGGKTNSLLTLGRVSNNKAKYEESWGVDASYLKIKKFGIDDGDSLYTCFHGFFKHPKNLTINGNNFALMPTEESLKKNVTVINGYLNANVEFLKVYPEPVCNCTFQKLGITEHINVSSDFYPTTSLFLNGKLHIAHQICHDECLGTIQIDCRIGIHTYKVFEAMIDIQLKCLQKKKDKEFTSIYVLATVMAVTLLVAIFVIVYLLKKTKDRAKFSIPETIPLKRNILSDENRKNKTEDHESEAEGEESLDKTDGHKDDMLLTIQPSSDKNLKDIKKESDIHYGANGYIGGASSDLRSYANV